MDNVNVRLADGSECALGDVRRRAEKGGVGVFFGVAQTDSEPNDASARTFGCSAVFRSSATNC